MTTLHVSVAGKTATYSRRDGAIVCGNDDYRIKFTFDDEWAGYTNKTAHFIWCGKYYDAPIENDEVAVPDPFNALELIVGVYVPNQIRTTTSAVIPCRPSVRSGGEHPQPGFGEHYTIAAQAAAAEAVAAAARAGEAVAGIEETASAARDGITEAASTARDELNAIATNASQAVSAARDEFNGIAADASAAVTTAQETLVSATDRAAEAAAAATAAGASSVSAATSASEAREAANVAKAATLAQETGITALNKRVTNLEERLTPDPFDVHEGALDVVPVPANALRYAEVQEVGGMVAEKPVTNLFDASKIPTYSNGATLDYAPNEMGGFNIAITSSFPNNTPTLLTETGGSLLVKDLCDAHVGETYTVSCQAQPANGIRLMLGATIMGGGVSCKAGESVTFVMTQTILDRGLGCEIVRNSTTETSPGSGQYQVSLERIMLAAGEVALPYVPYGTHPMLFDSKASAIVSKAVDGAELARITVPDAVQALDGYGWGISADLFNGIEWDPETGRPSFVKRVGRVTFDGSEGWWENTNVHGFFVCSTAPGVQATSRPLSNKYPTGMPLEVGVPCVYFSNTTLVIFPGTDATTLAEWEAKLVEWAAAGDPLTVYYQLATPVVTDVAGSLTSDNLLEVEPGGTINVEHTEEAVPTRIAFQLKS